MYQCERSYGDFQRQIALPDGVDPDTIQAHFDNGVLEVTMPMPANRSAKGKTIPITSKPAGGGGVKH